MSRIVVGLYDNFEDARDAIKDLIDHGFKRDDVSLIASDAKGEFSHEIDQQGNVSEDKGEHVAKDAGIGAVIGGLGGLILGLGALAIPGIGPIIAAGPIAGLLAGAGVGAAAGGLVGALTKSGVPEDQAKYYAEGVRRGGTLVTVNASDDMANRAVDIMNRHNPVDVDRRSQQWRQNNWQGFDPNAKPYTSDQIEQERLSYQDRLNRDGDVTIPVTEEELRVGKREVETGGVRVHQTVTEEPVEQTVNVRQEHVNVERRPVDRPATGEDMNAFQEGTMDVTEKGEEVVADKRARVKEEVHVSKDVEEHPETVRDSVRRTDVNVEDKTPQSTTSTTGFDHFEPIFRDHYNNIYGGNTTYTYEQYRPYYEYGYELGQNQQYRDSSWDQVEPYARRQWEQNYPDNPWDQFKDAIYQGWEAAHNR